MALAVMSAGLLVGSRGSWAQGSVTLMEPAVPLLPAKFGQWTLAEPAAGAKPGSGGGGFVAGCKSGGAG